MDKKCIENIEKEFEGYLESNKFSQIEKDIVQVLLRLMKLLLSIIEQKILRNQKTNFEEDFSKMKTELINYLNKKNYLPCAFKILKVEDFNETDNYLSELMRNLCYYLDIFDFKDNYLNLYYYQFHLIYFILLAIKNNKEKNLFTDDYIKFYIFHIVHFFKEDERTPEGYYFFYHGAFILLKKRYQIQTNFMIQLNFDSLFTMPNTIKNIFKLHRQRLSSAGEEESDKLDFVGSYSQNKEIISKKVENNIINLYENQSLDNYEELKDLFTQVSKTICEINKFLEDKKVESLQLENYNNLVKNFIKEIGKHELTKTKLVLMAMNLQNKFTMEISEYSYDYDIYKLIRYAELCNQCEEDSNVDFTNSFKDIINSKKFQELYITAMESSHIKSFVEKNNLSEEYNLFMNNYIKNIGKYILFVPLTKRIKAYVSNYLRIDININSVEIIGEFDQESKNDFFTAYLLIQLLNGSFHFIFKLKKINVLTSEENANSPLSKKISESYQEIGVDLILYIFGTEYILFINKKNCDLLCNIDSWKDNKTNFKVFNNVYLFNKQLVDDMDKEKSFDSGLKCNISLENELVDPKDFKICTDTVIRYCF